MKSHNHRTGTLLLPLLAAAALASCSGGGSTPTNPAQGSASLSFSGRSSSNPPLPVGFEDQLFATEHDAHGKTVSTTITWSAVTPDVATVDADGVVHALSAGTATLRATAVDGTTGTYSLSTTTASASSTARYAGNTEFGEPTDADAGDDFIVTRPEYTLSYNRNRGEPNWVSYELDASDFGAQPRCDCFTADPDLPASFPHLTTADYTGSTAAAGYGIDRGHLVRSYDRTAGALDNATTYYLSNIVPQASDLNQGPWADLESYLGDLAQDQNKEVYVIAGATGDQGTLKGEGRIVIPTKVWKVAVIMARGEGLADAKTPSDVQIVAVIMPNQAGIRTVDWHTYETTVSAVESVSGYDLLSKLPPGVLDGR